MPLIETLSFTNQAINAGKLITFTASPATYDLVQFKLWLYDLAAVSGAKVTLVQIRRNGTAIDSRSNIAPSVTTSATSVCLVSDFFSLSTGDILKVTLTGGATDTANVDIEAELWGIPDLSAAITIVDAVVDAIKAKTDNLPTDPADESLLEAAIANLPTAAEIDTQLSGTHGAGTWGNGSGSTSTTVTVNDGVNPIDGVDVWVSTDSAGTNVVARGSTGALGTVVFMLDAGTYYAWKQLAGYDFTNPQSFTVS